LPTLSRLYTASVTRTSSADSLDVGHVRCCTILRIVNGPFHSSIDQRQLLQKRWSAKRPKNVDEVFTHGVKPSHDLNAAGDVHPDLVHAEPHEVPPCRRRKN
jgi:hypothetical protein